LRATPRDVGPSIEARLNSLFGPLSVAETQARLLTAIPEGLNLHSATLTTNGTLTIDVTDEILSLSSGALIEAVAQIVFTALEVRNVQRVQLLVNGTSQQWPGGDGSLRTTALNAFDFPGLIETSQPNFPAVPSPDV
jgi:spore germination protein GerM